MLAILIIHLVSVCMCMHMHACSWVSVILAHVHIHACGSQDDLGTRVQTLCTFCLRQAFSLTWDFTHYIRPAGHPPPPLRLDGIARALLHTWFSIWILGIQPRDLMHAKQVLYWWGSCSSKSGVSHQGLVNQGKPPAFPGLSWNFREW